MRPGLSICWLIAQQVAVLYILTAMDYADARITISYTDTKIQSLLAGVQVGQGPRTYTLHYTQGEELFIRLPKGLLVPSLPIHHDVNTPHPQAGYLSAIYNVIEQLCGLVPDVFEGLTWYFDPRDHLRPAFFKLYKAGDQAYIYLFKIDLSFHPSRHTVVNRGTNDMSSEYTTSHLIIEADYIPIKTIASDASGRRVLTVSQTVSDTWVGETGRGYFVQGIWLDRELTRFFSKLFTPDGKRLYPYTPFTCKYRAVCHSVADLGAQGRKLFLPVVHHGREFINNHIKEIEDALRSEEFSDKLPCYVKLKGQIPGQWTRAFDGIDVRVYLNDDDMREYELTYGA